jgi:drug/metabolite transporter (DMT)-like permease
MPHPLRVWLAFALLCAIWGSSYYFIRIGLRQLSPLSLVAMRLLAGGLVTVAIALVRKAPLRLPGRTLLLLLFLATVNTTAPFLLIAAGEVTVPSGLASVLNSTMPIFSVLLAGFVLHDEPVTARRLLGVAIGFGGVVVILSRDLGHAGSSGALIGQAAIILSSLCYAGGAVFARRTLRGVPSMTIAAWGLIFSAIETVTLSLMFSRPALGSLHPQTIMSVLWLGVLGSGIAYLLSYAILAAWGASRYSLLAYVLPVVGLTLGIVFLGETLDGRIVAGTALVILGIVFVSLIPKQGRADAA